MKTLTIIVNYKSAALTFKAVRSVLDSQSLGSMDVAVVDNSEDEGEAERLRRGLPSTVRFHVSPENIGFGRACNLAVYGFRGDAILLLNPDARLLPGCLKRLQKTLFLSDRAGAVSSHLYWDEERTFYLPSSYPPRPLIFQDFLDTVPPDARIARGLSGLWRRHSINVWRSKYPIRVDNLSGGLVLLKEAAVRLAGGLFDPRFFLYFEDTDLFLRIKKAGFKLMVEPRAQAVHNYDQCGQENYKEKRSLMGESQNLFMEKHLRGWKRGVKNLIPEMIRIAEAGRNGVSGPHFRQPFALNIPDAIQDGWLFEVSPNPHFIPSAGRFGKGAVMEFPEACWKLLAPGRYFGRLGSPFGFGRYAQTVSWEV
ncbi:MAG: glycosyltransferase [Desulfobacteraceae bacterium]